MTDNSNAPHSLNAIRTDLVRFIGEALGEDLSAISGDTPIVDFAASSLALVEGMRRIYERFGVLVSIRRVLEGQATVNEIAAYIEQELNGARTRATGAPKGVEAPAPSTSVAFAPSQQHVGFLARYSNEASAAFNEALAVRLDGPLDAPALQAALDRVAERYEALRTALSPDRDEANVYERRRLELAVSAGAPGELDATLAEIVRRPFVPGDCLFRAELLRTPDAQHILLLVGHALVADAEALEVVLEELASSYSAYSENREPQVAFPALQWTDYLALRQTAVAREAEDAARTFWQSRCSEAWPHLRLPSDHVRPAIKRYQGARIIVPLEQHIVENVERWARSQTLTPAQVFFGAYAAYLSRLSRQRDVAIGVRSAPLYLDPEQRVMAQTRNMLPIRLSIEPAATFLRHVHAAAIAAAEAEQHRYLSLAEIIQLANQPRDQSRSALFTAAFAERRAGEAPRFGSLATTFVDLPAPGARYDIELMLSTTAGGTRLVCDFSAELFEPETVTRWVNGLVVLLRAGLEDSEAISGSLPIMPDGERHTLLSTWNRTETAYQRDKTVLDLFMAQAAARANRPAVRCGAVEWSYRDLLSRVEILAARLSTHGISAGDRVAILLERSADLPAAMLAVWRLGAAYVPLDRGSPPKRLAAVLDDAGVRVCITSRALAPLLPENFSGRTVQVDEGDASPAPLPEPGAPATPASSAYIMYTSGSTGEPKGVEVAHAGLVNCLSAAQAFLGFGAGDVLLAVTTPAFDISTVELFMPLVVGGVVDIVPDAAVADGVQLAETIASRRPDYMQATPSTWKAVLAAGWQGDDRLTVGATGESLSRELAEQLLARSRELWNLYGPTETTVWSAVCKIESAPGEPVPIGRPLANTQLFVLDDERQSVPLGAVGELYIGGDGLARGYWRRPDLTRDRFVPHPFRSGERVYRTGDLARWLPDGTLLCLGRSDDQVKVHGVRIELGEIEAALRKLAGVQDAVVTAWRDARGDAQLVAHIIATVAHVSAAEIRAQLREQLPEMMVPPYVRFTGAFPVTDSGKIRRADLPGPDIEVAAAANFEAPDTPTERLLAAAWSRVLDIDQAIIGRDAHFMDLGGHSLLMTPLMIEVRRLFGQRFNLREFFNAPTLRTLAQLIDDRRRLAPRTQSDDRPATTSQNPDWGRQRMAMLLRDAELPPSIAPARGATHQRSAIEHVLVTGATGFLGAYILGEILQTTGAEVSCLVRNRRGQEGRDRVEQQLRRYGVWRDDEGWLDGWRRRLHVVEGDVTLPRLGIGGSTYDRLARETDAVVHGAAHVNFIYPYEALRATNVLGLHEIIRFAFYTRIKQVHHLSTAAIWPMGAGQTFYERDPIEHGALLNLGYDEAKWVGERCLLNAEERGLPVARYRPGEVGGDSATGQCVTDHFVVAAIKGFLQFGAFPILDIELDIAPVDYVAKALTFLAFQRDPLGRAFHLTNPHRRHISRALTFLRSQGYGFDERPFEEIRDRLVSSRDFGSNALFPYQAVLDEMNEVNLQLPTYDTREAERELQGSGISCAPADDRLFAQYLEYLVGIGFMAPAGSSAGGYLSTDVVQSGGIR